ncbi:hypothetical protein CRG98_034123 [Punica granatum]|uniref:Uncharacterized protein n=1 Tax=Punica granatum TaxID=22663 RepID=A0A2I0IN88_PUNGR|nr:hypothetical protein CRG98_034123 [Punica granatum]
MWVEVHDIDEQEAFLILVELSNKNLISSIKDSRVGELCSSYSEAFVIQHNVLRDLALHLNHQGEIYERERLVMPKREAELPREWERYSDRPFNARIVSIHTAATEDFSGDGAVSGGVAGRSPPHGGGIMVGLLGPEEAGEDAAFLGEAAVAGSDGGKVLGDVAGVGEGDPNSHRRRRARDGRLGSQEFREIQGKF